MQFRLSLFLPRDEITIPVVRRICRQAMDTLGVAEECRDDLELALTEACANVLRHAQSGVEYEVVFGLEGEECTIEVLDRGAGFDSSGQGQGAAEESERGRGIQLMRALVDSVRFEPRAGAGTLVRLEKSLVLQDGAAIRRLSGPPTVPG